MRDNLDNYGFRITDYGLFNRPLVSDMWHPASFPEIIPVAAKAALAGAPEFRGQLIIRTAQDTAELRATRPARPEDMHEDQVQDVLEWIGGQGNWRTNSERATRDAEIDCGLRITK